MATAESCWSSLPSVILLEVFSYLPHQDKIRASSTCKHWRYALFHSSFWQSIHFKVKMRDQNSILRTRFLASCFAKKLRNATVSLDTMDPLCMQEAARVLQKLSENIHLRRFILKTSHSRFECPGRESEEKQRFLERHLIKPLENMIQQSRGLEVFSLGCSEELTMHAGVFLDLLGRYQAHSLQQLNLASVKDDPENYLLLDIDPAIFKPFYRLQVLSLDYDCVSDSLLEILSKSTSVGLARFVIHIHGVEDNHPGTSSSSWSKFCKHNPHCELHLTLIHSYDAVEILHTDIFKPTMPLTHLKAFFCEQVNIHALHRLSTWYAKTLKSLWWVDSFGSPGNNRLVVVSDVDETQPDPIVMAAWRCTHLEEIVLIGQKYYEEDLIAIARLRGAKLKRLDIAEEDLIEGQEYSDSVEYEVSEALHRRWTPLPNNKLHDVIHNPSAGDSDEYVLPVVLQDQDVL